MYFCLLSYTVASCLHIMIMILCNIIINMFPYFELHAFFEYLSIYLYMNVFAYFDTCEPFCFLVHVATLVVAILTFHIFAHVLKSLIMKRISNYIAIVIFLLYAILVFIHISFVSQEIHLTHFMGLFYLLHTGPRK